MKSVLKKFTAVFTALIVVASAADGAAVFAASSADVRAYITTLNGYLDSLYVKMRKCKKAGIPTDYEQVTYSVLERWAKKYLNDDIENEWFTYFDSYTKPELDRMYREANENLSAYLNGTKTAVSVPRYISSDMETDGYTVTALTKDADGTVSRRPVFFTGFGHFEDAAADIPKFQSFGMNTIQNEIGPDSIIKEGIGWSVSCIGGADAGAELCKSEKHDGEYSLRVSNKTPKAPGVYVDVSQQVRLTKNTAYTLSLWVKAENASGISVSHNGGKSRLDIEDGTYDWKKFSYSFTTDSQTSSGQIWILAEDVTDAVFVDGIELIADGTSENAASNGDFEDYVPGADGKYYVYAKGADATVRMLENAEKNNIAVSLLLSPHYFPEFLLEKYPEICGNNGIFIPHSEKTLEILGDYLAALMPRIKAFKSLNNICLTNEPRFCPAEYGDFYKLQWTEFLRDKYGSLASANRTFGTAYTDWAEIGLQTKYDSTALGYDNRLFARRLFTDWHKFLANTVRSYAPDIPIHAKATGYIGTHALFNTNLDANANYEYFDEFSDLAGCDYSVEWSGISSGIHRPLSESLWYDYLAGAGGKPVINSEDHMYVDSEENFTKKQRLWMQTNVWQGAIHHRAFSQIWTWRKEYSKKSIYYGSMLFRPDCIQAIGKTGLDLNRLSYEVNALVTEPEDTAILYSSASRQYKKGHMYSVYDAYEACLFNGKKVRIVTENRFDALDSCRVLILADCTNAPQSTVDAVLKFAADGGRVISTGAAPFTADENNAPRTDGTAEAVNAAAETAASNISLAEWLETYYNRNGMQKVLITDADSGERVSDTEWTYAEYNGGLLVNICNFDMSSEKSVRISVDGRNITAAEELRSGTQTGEVITLSPYEPVLIYIGGTKPCEADNLRTELCGNGQLRLSWNINDENADGVNIYRRSGNGELTRLLSTPENSCTVDISADGGTDTFVVKAYNTAGVESFGKAVSYSGGKPFSVSCTAVKNAGEVKCSIYAAAEAAAAGTVFAVLRDGDGSILGAATVGKSFIAAANGGNADTFEVVFRDGEQRSAAVEVYASDSADGKDKLSDKISVKL